MNKLSIGDIVTVEDSHYIKSLNYFSKKNQFEVSSFYKELVILKVLFLNLPHYPKNRSYTMVDKNLIIHKLS